MGIYDSSRTRAAPVFDRLFAADPTGTSWLPCLLGLVGVTHNVGQLVEARWWPTEKALLPPLGVLEWLVQHLEEPAAQATWRDVSPATAEWRKRLIARDTEGMHAALDALRGGQRYAGWHVLEGPSYPDVYLGTKDTLVVIEGKRTERGPTTNTTWMRGRHQVLRHLDGAFEVLGGRRLIGLVVVEAGDGESTPAAWIDYLAEVRSEEALRRALPHRSPEQRATIGTALAGVTTWQAVCGRLGVPADALLHEVREVVSAAAKVRTAGLLEEIHPSPPNEA